MLIKQLISGRKKADLIIVKDNLHFCSAQIVNLFIEANKQRSGKVHVLVTSICKSYVWESQNVAIHKYFPDPWKMIKGREAELSFNQIVDCIAQERKIDENTSILFVIDSVSSLLQYMEIDKLCGELKKIVKGRKETLTGIQVVCVCNSDVMPDDSVEYKNLKYMAMAVINLTSLPGRSPQVDLEYRQNNGKIIEETYSCSFGARKEVEFKMEKKEEVKEAEDPGGEPLVKTTFKLTLDEKEKESRSQVVLPYIKASNPGGVGRIYYEPDANDDWDDEDPDDDLEI